MMRLLSDVKAKTYEDRLKEVGLTTLKERRLRGDMIETFKTLKGFNKVEKDKWFTVVGEDARATRMTTIVTNEGEIRKENVLQMERARLDVRKNFFTVRATRHWNDLPEEVKRQTSINAFKNSYDRLRGNSSQNTSDELVTNTTTNNGMNE